MPLLPAVGGGVGSGSDCVVGVGAGIVGVFGAAGSEVAPVVGLGVGEGVGLGVGDGVAAGPDTVGEVDPVSAVGWTADSEPQDASETDNRATRDQNSRVIPLPYRAMMKTVDIVPHNANGVPHVNTAAECCFTGHGIFFDPRPTPAGAWSSPTRSTGSAMDTLGVERIDHGCRTPGSSSRYSPIRGALSGTAARGSEWAPR